jgi:hypothetical protein
MAERRHGSCLHRAGPQEGRARARGACGPSCAAPPRPFACPRTHARGRARLFPSPGDNQRPQGAGCRSPGPVGPGERSEDRRRFFFQSRISTAALITVLHSGMQPPDHQPPQIRCSKCKRFKEQGAFLPRYDRKRGRRQPCRQCRRRLRKPSSGWAELRRTVILRSIALWLLGDECVRCGERDPVVLDFDHIDPETKDFSLSAAFRVLSWKRILEEVRKCQILCANDHRRKTAEALEATAKHSRRVVREFHLQPNVAPIRYIP